MTKYISCKCKCKFDGRKFNSNQKFNSDKCRCECKKHVYGKGFIRNPATCYGNRKYLAGIIGDLVIMCDDIIDAEAKSNNEETKIVAKNFNEKNIICKTQNFYILLGFL